MIHIVLLFAGVFLVVWGIVICVVLFSVSIKIGKGIWLVTVPGIFVVAMLAIDFACHVLHLPRHVVPYQTRTISAIHWTLRAATIPLLLMKLYELWSKRRAKAIRRPKDALPSE